MRSVAISLLHSSRERRRPSFVCQGHASMFSFRLRQNVRGWLVAHPPHSTRPTRQVYTMSGKSRRFHTKKCFHTSSENLLAISIATSTRPLNRRCFKPWLPMRLFPSTTPFCAQSLFNQAQTGQYSWPDTHVHLCLGMHHIPLNNSGENSQTRFWLRARSRP